MVVGFAYQTGALRERAPCEPRSAQGDLPQLSKDREGRASRWVSPDGNFVAFNWSGPDFTQPGDLWVKPVEGEALRRLTDTPQANEIYPAWSPDGRQIAYSRTDAGEGRGVYVISALGGAERKLTDWGLRPSWLPDSQSLVFEDRVADAQLPVHYVIATGARRPLTAPPPGFIDTTPKVSPDGKAVAFVRSTREHSARFGTTMVAALFVVPLAGGEPLRLDDWVSGLGGPEWTPDSREIFYPRWNAGGTRIFRVPAAGGVPSPPWACPSAPTRSPSPVSGPGERSGSPPPMPSPTSAFA
jgi:Tol biopolymer transport system component